MDFSKPPIFSAEYVSAVLLAIGANQKEQVENQTPDQAIMTMPQQGFSEIPNWPSVPPRAADKHSTGDVI